MIVLFVILVKHVSEVLTPKCTFLYHLLSAIYTLATPIAWFLLGYISFLYNVAVKLKTKNPEAD